MQLIFQQTQNLIKDFLRALGLLVAHCLDIIEACRKSSFEKQEFLAQADRLLSSSWQSVAAIMLALGVAIGVQLAPEFDSRGIGSEMGIVSALTMIRELGPVMGSLMIATQYGSSTAAELSNMKITEQVDALKVFRVSPVSFLVLPRLLAALFLFPIINWLASLLGVVSCYITANMVAEIQLRSFANSIWSYLKVEDLMLCFIKSAIFGALVVLIASSVGLSTSGGAKEVGKATTTTVIVSFVMIVVVDFLITALYL